MILPIYQDLYPDKHRSSCLYHIKRYFVYAKKEWHAFETILQNGDVEVSNNLCEQMKKHIKMNLKNCLNIGSEDSAMDYAFMFSAIESCDINRLSPETYLTIRLCFLQMRNDMVDTIKQYEDQKIKEVVLYILSKTGVVDYYHLMKILYLAERQHLVRWGAKITTDDYYALPHGPVPSRIYDSLKEIKDNRGGLFADIVSVDPRKV